ncbi:class I SAM-dependent methyltransferase [Pedobacter chinensis]|uniref:Class I SAM-dependent methyltransferase n=1 Tax=Pedobacter chinensis TaxID=2282421 RepID=A0A369Q0M6_9SPHI|nr:class I SAM-dependent methyltransferase [Pedobacter chinensis]RDC56787.1 class I SAM-dependent methyltransferase [Pedobacter chinensis]
MEHQHSEEDLKNIAKQLSHPEGEHGIKTGEAMNINNSGMIHSAIDNLNLQFNDYVLEIGPGNGAHLEYFLGKEKNLIYFGVDISKTMIEQANKLNSKFVGRGGSALFHLVDGSILPFITEQFDKIFTVNTIYFWKNPLEYLQEIKRVLKPKGTFVLCFADKSFMEKLPFTKYGFTLYEPEELKMLLSSAGFDVQEVIKKTEQINSNADFRVERDYYVISASSKGG